MSAQKKKPWSHQTELSQNIGRKIKTLGNGAWQQATLLAADNFTVKLECDDQPGVHLVVFKHSIMTYFFPES